MEWSEFDSGFTWDHADLEPPRLQRGGERAKLSKGAATVAAVRVAERALPLCAAGQRAAAPARHREDPPTTYRVFIDRC
ncbi:hypothetical protein [Streptosporangium vulgare]|uniref:hypothetical protein n=1 Tax=Streptosporangium vulgare TaxID=46190 RepID=UPI0031CF9816